MRGFSGSTIRLIVPPFPAASRPSKITTTLSSRALIQSCSLTSSSCTRSSSRSNTSRLSFFTAPGLGGVSAPRSPAVIRLRPSLRSRRAYPAGEPAVFILCDGAGRALRVSGDSMGAPERADCRHRSMHSDLLLVIVVVAALAFDFTNGFHDTANVVASSISTRALSPRTAVLIAAALNFAGAFISLKVAATVATGIVNAALVTQTIVFAGLIGAIVWNLVTWFFGLPSSSSHALIGGVVGAMLAAVGTSGVEGGAIIGKVVVPAIVAPVLALLVAGISIVIIYWIVGRRRPGPVTKGFKLGEIVS